MKRKRHTPEQIIAKLREADALLGGGATIGQVCQKLGVAEVAVDCWWNQPVTRCGKPRSPVVARCVSLGETAACQGPVWWHESPRSQAPQGA